MKTALIWLHRWLTLALLPLFVFLAVTGAILALQPVVQDLTSGPALEAPVPVAEAADLLRRADPEGQARALRFEAPGIAVIEATQAGARAVHGVDMDSARPLGPRAEGAAFFHWIGGLHKHLVWGLDWLVVVAACALVPVVVAGPFLAWPRLRNTAMGWHMGLGWAAAPVLAVVAVTAAMLALGLGTGGTGPVDRSAGRMALPAALEAAARDAGLTHVTRAEVHKRAAVAITGTAGGDPVALWVTRDGVRPVAAQPPLVRRLHDGTWGGAWSGALYLAGMLAMLGLMGTGLWSWGRRVRGARVRMGDRDADVLVAWGSQTGTAAALGAATVAALRAGGARVAGASLAALSLEEVARHRHAFFIVSTTGDGDLPETARAFHAALGAPAADLGALRFGLLALGDSSYRRFCAGGLALRDALLAAGAHEVLAPVKADRDPAAPWRDWLAQVGAQLSVTPASVPAPEGDRPVTLTLRRRRQLNDPADPDSTEVWALELVADGAPDAVPDWAPGDLLLVSPAPGTPERPYSIGSSPLDDPRTIALTVALAVRDTPQGRHFGQASQLLCRDLAEGARLSARLRRHAAFHLPDDPDRPVIMVATGCGIAPFPGFIAHKAAGGHRGPMWLFFGTRKRDVDYFHGARLEGWHRDGVLNRLDPAFDAEPGGGFVQDRMIARGAEILDWLERRGAVLHACGRRGTVGAGVQAALRAILTTHGGLTPEAAAARIADWTAAGRLRLDLTD